MRIAMSGNVGLEETVLVDAVLEDVLVLLCGACVGTGGADDVEPVELQAPNSNARAGTSHKRSRASCIDFLYILLSPIRF
jgi:hypothetical protein